MALAAILWRTLHYAGMNRVSSVLFMYSFPRWLWVLMRLSECIVDIACFARSVTQYCIRELYPDVQAGRWDALRIGGTCYQEFIDVCS